MQKTILAAAFAAVFGVGGAYAADLNNGRNLYAGGTKDGWTSSDIIDSNNQISVQFVTTDFGYKEVSGSAPLDTESNCGARGWVSFSLMKNWFVSNLYFNAQYSYADGKTDYVGSYWGGTFGSLKTQDTAIVNDFDFRLGKGFELQRNLMATPYFGIGFHDWQRGGNGGEEYSHGYYGAGLLLQWSPFSRFVLSGNGLIGQTFNSQIAVGSFFRPAASWDLP